MIPSQLLVAAHQIQDQADRAREARITAYNALTLADVYDELREKARKLHRAAGWDEDLVEREFPPLKGPALVTGARTGISPHPAAQSITDPALIRLGQLSGWAGGIIAAFTTERRLEIEAEQRVKLEADQKRQAARPPVGFHDS